MKDKPIPIYEWIRSDGSKGFTLFELLMTLAILGIVLGSIFGIYITTFRVVGVNRSRVVALELLTERMERIKQMDYADIGTTFGWPSGTIPSTETVLEEEITFIINADVRYIDDPFDGLVTDPTPDPYPADYKRIALTVNWEGFSNVAPPKLVSNVVPPGLESQQSGGTFILTAFDADGAPVAGASVTVTNPDEGINISTTTDVDGKVILVILPPDDGGYHVVVSKTGFSTDSTYPVDPINNPAPTKPDLTSIDGEVTEASFAIDEVADLTITTYRTLQNGELADDLNPYPDVTLDIHGAKLKGTEPTPLYKYTTSASSDANGVLTLSDIEWDEYSAMPSGGTGLTVSGFTPAYPITVPPASATALSLRLAPTSTHSLIVTVHDQGGGPVIDATVTLSESGSGYTKTLTTTDWGQTFFRDLNVLTFTLDITAAGFSAYSDTTQVSGFTLTTVTMAP
ncbi:MAG: carboxypeptidase regulatory-like domain-containing protein [Parcubacteria group bacterium]|nr:carboxypeptidase regulatory-like domain-containing protein [Parcubacteria group bacterium]